MYVCICRAVTKRVVLATIQQGARSVDEVGRACGAGTDCGACRGCIEELIDEHNEQLAAQSAQEPYLASAAELSRLRFVLPGAV